MLKNVLKQNHNIFDIFNMSVTCNYFPYLEIKLFKTEQIAKYLLKILKKHLLNFQFWNLLFYMEAIHLKI